MEPRALLAALDATWPAAETLEEGGWHLRRGLGGGQRVSAASPLRPDAPIAAAEAVMKRWGQAPIFQLTPDDAMMDARLADAGYRVHDPVRIYAAPVDALLDEKPEVARIFRGSYRVALVEEIWRAGGIDGPRFAVMDRAPGPKTYLLSRIGDRPGAVGFVALSGSTGFLHAIETAPDQRRKGAARMILCAAARFAKEGGASILALAVTEANAPARALYRSVGMGDVARYHYRIKGSGETE